MPKCDACPASGPCEGEVASRVCHLAAHRPDYRAKIVEHCARPSLAGIALAEPLDEYVFVTREMLAADAKVLTSHMPPDVDLVVAIARSGWLVGADIAIRRHLPIRSVSRHGGLVDPGHGFRMEGHVTAASAWCPRHVLVVDDTVASGREMAACSEIVRRAFPTAKITRAVAYVHPATRHAVDLYVRDYPGLHYLEWNWSNAGHGAKCAFDFDGILCHDDDPDFKPLFLPVRTPIPLIVTGRHESARRITQDWLDRWGVRCERLAMRAFGAVDDYSGSANFKATEYAKRPDIKLFAESDPKQAETIAALSGKAVLCPSLGRVIPASRPEAMPLAESQARAAKAKKCRHRNAKSDHCTTFECKKLRQRIGLDTCRTCPETD